MLRGQRHEADFRDGRVDQQSGHRGGSELCHRVTTNRTQREGVPRDGRRRLHARDRSGHQRLVLQGALPRRRLVPSLERLTRDRPRRREPWGRAGRGRTGRRGAKRRGGRGCQRRHRARGRAPDVRPEQRARGRRDRHCECVVPQRRPGQAYRFSTRSGGFRVPVRSRRADRRERHGARGHAAARAECDRGVVDSVQPPTKRPGRELSHGDSVAHRRRRHGHERDPRRDGVQVPERVFAHRQHLRASRGEARGASRVARATPLARRDETSRHGSGTRRRTRRVRVVHLRHALGDVQRER